jgi:pimeloyl-ACP methyl ester carboxylesterase
MADSEPVRNGRGQEVKLAYTENGAGRPLVLITGLGASGAAWEPHTAVWSRKFR